MRKLLAIVGVAAVMAIGGFSAFTASNTGQPTTLTKGYSQTAVSGITMSSFVVTYGANDSQVTGATFTAAGDTTALSVEMGVGSSSNPALTDTCGGTFNTDHTDYVCTLASPVATSNANYIAVVASE